MLLEYSGDNLETLGCGSVSAIKFRPWFPFFFNQDGSCQQLNAQLQGHGLMGLLTFALCKPIKM